MESTGELFPLSATNLTAPPGPRLRAIRFGRVGCRASPAQPNANTARAARVRSARTRQSREAEDASWEKRSVHAAKLKASARKLTFSCCPWLLVLRPAF